MKNEHVILLMKLLNGEIVTLYERQLCDRKLGMSPMGDPKHVEVVEMLDRHPLLIGKYQPTNHEEWNSWWLRSKSDDK